VDETGVGDEPPMSTTVGFLMAALVLASLLSSCATGWPPPPTAPEGVIVLGRTYVVQDTDGRGQAQTERGARSPWIRQSMWCWRSTARPCFSPKRASMRWSKSTDGNP
jgi:hypothetical protein